MASVLGIPGQLDNSNLMVKKVVKVFNVFLNLAWVGMPFLAIASVVSFYFYWTGFGIAFSTISLSLGLGCFISLITFMKLVKRPSARVKNPLLNLEFTNLEYII